MNKGTVDKQVARKVLFLVTGTFAVIALLSGCASTTIYGTGIKVEKDGTKTPVPVKRFATSGDIQGAFTLTSTAKGDFSLDVKPLKPDEIAYAYVAVTDSKGNPLLDKEGKPIFNTMPYTAGLNHSRPTGTFLDGLSKLFRSIGSVIGTVAASITGASVAGDLAGAIPPSL